MPPAKKVLPYMTPFERKAFRRDRASGRVTFFRADVCKCGEEVPRGKAFCSEACFEKDKKLKEEETDE